MNWASLFCYSVFHMKSQIFPNDRKPPFRELDRELKPAKFAIILLSILVSSFPIYKGKESQGGSALRFDPECLAPLFPGLFQCPNHTGDSEETYFFLLFSAAVAVSGLGVGQSQTPEQRAHLPSGISAEA